MCAQLSMCKLIKILKFTCVHFKCPNLHYKTEHLPKRIFSEHQEIKMESFRKLKVLSECRILLKYMNLGRKNKIRVCGFIIPNSIIFIVLSIPLGFSITSIFLTIIDVGINLKNAYVFLIFLGSVQVEIFYICMAMNNGVIIKAVDLIQEIVDRSRSIFEESFIDLVT